eukprot:scaffold1080_cov195-Cylindrotheca_fusiformis.AAC.3
MPFPPGPTSTETLEPEAKRPKIELDSRDDKEKTASIDHSDESPRPNAGYCQDEEIDGSASPNKENPFACFAFKSGEPIPPKKESRFQKRSTLNKPDNKKVENDKKGQSNAFIKMADVDAAEQERIRKKWHSLVDPTASLEVKRFQLLVAARLHARCQEASVHKAMNRLREMFSELSVEQVAAADPQVLASCITNVVHYNVKAQHIVKSAQEIISRFKGKVPEDEKSLLELTGIGKVFADLLGFINTRQAYSLE